MPFFRTSRWRLPLLCSLLFLAGRVQGKTTRFDFRDAGLRNLIHFVSDAPLEKILGISNFVSGWLEIDTDHLGDGAKGEFQVDVRTFETGIDSRNDQLREKIFNAAEYPIATFTVDKVLSVSKDRLANGKPVSARIQGQLKIKGVSHTQAILVKLLYLKETEITRMRLTGNLLKLSASFDVDTSQFNLAVPQAFRQRFSNFVQVEVDAIGTDSLPNFPLTSRLEGPKPKERRN